MDNKILNLSSQEYCVLEHLNKGYSSKMIAKKLEISPYTVNGHLKSIYIKWNVNSRGEAQNRFNEYFATIASNELNSQTKDKAALASELVTANIELLYQTQEKINRADELVIANEDKAARASELVTANIELLYQTQEKINRADELVIANEDKAARASELVILKRELIQLCNRAQEDEKQNAKRVALNQRTVNYCITTGELEALFSDKPR